MTEKELIKQLKQLRQIKPNKEWRELLEERILREGLAPQQELGGLFSLFFKPVFAGVFSLAVITGLFVYSQNSLPGDLLYPVKRITEKSQVLLVAESRLPSYELEKANKRLEEISKLIETGKTEPVKKLQPVINEFQANVSQAAKILIRDRITTSSDPVLIKKVVREAKRLEENKDKVEKLGVAVGENQDLDDALAELVAQEIDKLDQTILSEAQQETFSQVKSDYENRDYSSALEKILLLSYPQLSNQEK